MHTPFHKPLEGKEEQIIPQLNAELKKLKDENPDISLGEVTDTYHTFNQLYHQRAILFSIICNLFPHLCYKSKLHSDGTMFEGMFVVGINTLKGQFSYHYDIEPYWEYFKVPEVERAPEWDGHTEDDALERLSSLLTIYNSWR